MIRAAILALVASCAPTTTPTTTPTAPTAPTTTPTAPAVPRNADGDLIDVRPDPHPDIVVGKILTAYVGPRFYTGEGFVPFADTVIADETGRVRALIDGPPPKGYPVVTLPGALGLAGLHDAHIHIQGVGRARDQVQLIGVTSSAEAKKRVVAWAKGHPEASVVEGRGWDQSRFPGGAWPTAKDLDGASTKPIVLERVDGHAVWVDNKALALAGIGKDTPDPSGGKIIRDKSGDAVGVLVDNAMELVTKKLPPPSAHDVERWLVAGMNACADAGLVALHDMGMNVEAAKILARLDDDNKLPVRVFVYLDGTDDASYAWLGERKPSEHLRIMGVKLYADGAMGSRGAALLAPYSDDPQNSGLLVTDPKVLAERVARVHQKGYAAAVHAIGDRANRIVLDAMKASPAPAGARDRIEHAQLIAAEDFARFREQHVVASMQPTHATSDMRWAEARVGNERLKGAYAWRTMLDRHVSLAFGSDAPVESEAPLPGIYAAITRQDADGNPAGGFMAEQKLTLPETLKAFAAGAAYAVGMEQHLGALTPGMFFDVTLLSDDVAKFKDPKVWLTTKPMGTVVGGVLRVSTGGK